MGGSFHENISFLVPSMSYGYEHMDLMVFPRTLQGSHGYKGQRCGRSPILLSEPILEIHWNLF